MRTLKKTLALVLCLAMMVGLCAVAASAKTIDDYTDKDEIPNLEAIATLTAIGVFQGDDTGAFRANDALIRAEGATLGAKMHGTSGSGTSSFTDMGSYAWAQGAVSFCESNGIIAGYGDGTFGPSDPLSTVAFAKICLTSLGWDAEKEGLVGPQWEINTIKLVNALDLANGIGNPDWNAPIPRWQAGQFCYNTLKATMVDYNNGLNFTVTTSDGTKVEVGTGASAVENNSYDYRNNLVKKDGIPTGNTMQFCEQYFPNLKMKTNVADDTFGFKNNVWYKGDTRVDHNLTAAKTIVKELASNVLATYDTGIGGVTGKTLYTDGHGDKDHTALKLTVNGYTVGTDVLGAYGVAIKMDRLGTTPVLTGFAGGTAYLVDNDDIDQPGYGIADELIVKAPLLAKVNRVVEATSSKDRYVALSVYTEAGTVAKDFGTKDFAKGDFIVVYPRWTAAYDNNHLADKPYFMESELAEVVAGTYTKKTNVAGNPYSLTIGGVAYPIGAEAWYGPSGAVGGISNSFLNAGVTAYLSNGFILGLVPDAVAYGEFVFVLKEAPNGSLLNTNAYNVASVDQTAATSEVTASAATGTELNWASKSESGSYYKFAKAKGETAYLTVPFTFATGSNGPELKSDKAVLGSGTQTLVDGVTTNHINVVADNATVFVVRSYSTTAGYSFKAYTGLNNVPNYEKLPGDGYALVPDSYPGAHAVAVYFDTTGAEVKGAATDAIYLLSAAAKPNDITKTAGQTIYTYKAIVDGEVKDVQSKANDLWTAAGAYTPTYTAGYLTKAETISSAKVYTIADDATRAVVVANGNITVPDLGDFVLAKDVVAYYYDAANFAAPLSSGAPIDIVNGVYKGTITLIPSKDDATIATIYFTAG